MKRIAALTLAILSAVCLLAGGASAELSEVRVGTLKFGTVNWELGVIADGLDRKHGFALKPVVLADNDATSVALLSGDVDAIVTDWIWVAKQRSLGRDYTFVPYSRSVGALMVDPKKGFKTITDLKGHSIGVAGGATNKNWLLLEAYARNAGFDLAKEADIQFAAPPVLNELLVRGKLDAVANFWNFNARLEQQGMVPLLTVAGILPQLGLKQPPPLIGWVFSEKWADANPTLAKGLIAASTEAKHALQTDDGVWLKLRPKMDADNDALFEALKAGYRAGIPARYGPEDVEAAKTAFKLMHDVDPASVAGLDALPEGTFWPSYWP